MKILLFGADGQLGWQLRRSLCVVGEVTALTRSSDSHCGDVADAAGVARTVDQLRPDVIVNAAAYTAVDRAESEPVAADLINHRACEVLAVQAERIGAWLVHYSTEYVFDGSGTAPWRESDATAPLNVYGRSKLAGEKAIAGANPRHLILRTSWLFDTWGDNFLKWLLGAAAERPSLDIVFDQHGAPTRAAIVADVTAHLLRALRPELAGTYHVAAAGEASRHELAVFALQCAQKRGLRLQAGPGSVRPVPSSSFPRPAARPANSRMDTHRLRKTFGLALPYWHEGVDAVVAEIARAARA